MKRAGLRKRVYQTCLTAGFLILLFTGLRSAASSQTNTLRIAFHSEAIPYSFVDENGEAKGFLIELVTWLAAQSGYQAEFVPYDRHSSCSMALLNKEVDAVIGNKNQMGDDTLYRTLDPLVSSSMCLVVLTEQAQALRDTQDFSDCRAVYEYGTVMPLFLYSLRARQYISGGVQEDLLKALQSGRAEIALMDFESCMYLMQKPQYKDRFTILRRDMGAVDYTLILRKEDQMLSSQLERIIIDAQTSGAYEAAADRWLANNREENLERLRRLWIVLGVIAATAVAVIVFIIWMNRLLSRKVTEKTAELEKANRLLDEKILALENDSRLRRDILENSPNGMVAFDTKDRVTLINRAALSMAGLESIPEGCQIKDLPLWSELLRALSDPDNTSPAVSNGQPHEAALTVDGQPRKFRCALICGASDPEGERILSAEDITDEEQERQKLFEQEKNLYLNRFVAGIAHEIKNPLMSIRTAASLLKDNPSDREVQEAAAYFVPEEVDRINQLVEGLVHYARPVKGEQSIFEVRPLIEECLYLVELATKKSSIRYTLALEPGLYVQAHRDRLKQSLLNIIMNSLESMEERLQKEAGQTLTLQIRAYGREEYVTLTVRDEGMGMNEQAVRNCLNPFYTTKARGTGLGLTLVRQYLDENGGKLSIESREGEYTQITLQLRRIPYDEA